MKRGKGLSISPRHSITTRAKKLSGAWLADLNITREYFRLRVIEDGYKLKWAVEPLRGEIRSGDVIVVRLKINGAKPAI